MGQFQPGQVKPKGSGRKKGTPNRNTANLAEALDRLGHNLPTKITELLPKLSAEKQIDVYLELMQYVYPKRKSVEQSIEMNETQELSVDEKQAKIARLFRVNAKCEEDPKVSAAYATLADHYHAGGPNDDTAAGTF